MKMEEIEYQKLTALQKDFVDALKFLGFKWLHFTYYEKNGWGKIEVGKFSSLSSLLVYVHEQGKDQKRFEIQRTLGI